MEEYLRIFIVPSAFLMGLITDWVWTKYFKTVAQHRALAAANWSLGIYLCSLFATTLLIDKQYDGIIAYMVGGWIGTFFAVKHGEPKNDVA